MRNQKSFIFVMTLIVLLIGLTAISAADNNNNNITTSVVSDNTVNTHSDNSNKIVSDTNKVSDNVKIDSATSKVSNNKKEITSDTKKVTTENNNVKTIKSESKTTKTNNEEKTIKTEDKTSNTNVDKTSINKKSVKKEGKIETKISVPDNMICVIPTENMTINGTLSDIDNNPIANAPIKIEVDNMDPVNVNTNDTGAYYYSFKTSEEENDHINVKVSYEGNDTYYPIDSTTWFYTERPGSQISVDEIDTADPSSKLNITGKLVITNTIVPIKNATVYITINDTIYDTITDENGNYVKTITTPDANNTYKVSVEYKGSEKYDGSTDSMELRIKTKSIINVETIPATIVNNNVTIRGNLTDIDGKILRDIKIVMTIGNETLLTETNSTGEYTFNYTARKGGEIPVTITCMGDNYYSVSSTQTTLTVTRYNSKLIIDNIENAKINDTVVVTGKVTNDTNNPIIDGNVIITINGDYKEATTDENGTFKAEFTAPSKADTYTVTAKYAESDSYYESNNETTLNVEKINSVITIDEIANTDPNTSIDITGKLVTDKNVAIAGATVVVTVNNKPYTTTTNTDGTYTVSVITPESGNYTVTAKYEESDAYLESTDDTGLVVKTESIIDVDAPIIATINNKVNITGTLVDANKKGISNATVVITIDGTPYTTTTDKDGKYVYEYTATKIGENIPVKVAFNGNDNYTAIDTETTMDVEKISSTLTIDTISPVDINDTVVITGKLTEKYTGKAIAGASVVVNVNGTDKEAITDENGTFKAEFTAPSKANTYTVTAKYAESDIYYESSDETTLDVEKINSVITVDEITNVVPNSNINITGKLVTDKNTPIANATVLVIFNDNYYDDVVTDANGNYKVEVTTPSKSDNYTVDVSYDGSNVYVESYNTTNIYVGKLNTTTTVDAVKGDIHQNVTLVAHVVDQYNKTVTSGEVIFTINGVNVTDAKGNVIYAEVKDGIATITTQAINAWAKNDSQIIATYLGNEMYNSSQSTSAPVEIALKTPTIKVFVDKSTVKVGDLINFIAQVTDNGQLVKQGKVVFKLNGKTLKNEKGEILFVNVVNGIAQLPYSLDTSFSAKVYNLTAVYAGRDYNRMEATINLTVVKTNTHIEADIVNVTGTNTAKLKVSILDENNELVGRWTKVTIKVNGKTVYNETNVTAGMQYFDINLPAKDIFNITIIAGENSVYKSSRTTISYDRTALKTSNKITVKTYDNNNNIVTKDTNVSLKVDDTTVTKQIPTNGILNSNITTPTTKETNNITANTNSTVITTVKA